MTVSTPSSKLGRHVFGVAALASGIITLAWHDYNDWLNCVTLSKPPPLPRSSAAWRFSSAAALGVIYLFFALLCVPEIIVSPQIYDSWGNSCWPRAIPGMKCPSQLVPPLGLQFHVLLDGLRRTIQSPLLYRQSNCFLVGFGFAFNLIEVEPIFQQSSVVCLIH
jgi:hypothetical protein